MHREAVPRADAQAMFFGPAISSRTWQRAMLALGIVCSLLLGWAASYLPRGDEPGLAGTLGFGSADGPDGRRVVTAIEPGSPLDAAGGRVGDRIAFDHPSDRYRWIGTDETIGLTLFRDAAGEGSRHVSLRPMPDPDVVARPMASRIDSTLTIFVQAMWLALGLLIAWRQPRPGPMRILAPFFMLSSLFELNAMWPSGWFSDHVAPFLIAFVQLADVGGFAYFCLRYPEERPPWRHPWVRVGFLAIAGVATAHAIASSFYLLDRLTPMLVGPARSGNRWLPLGLTVVALSSLVASWRGTHGAVRQRLAWILLSLGISFGISEVSTVLDLAGVHYDQKLLDLAVETGLLIGMLVLTYALLRHRVFDFGFAFNRLVVYGLCAVLLVAAGLALETVAGAWLDLTHRVVSLAVASVTAVVLAALLPWLRRAAEAIVQRLLYPRWRATGAALQAALDGAAQVQGPGSADRPLPRGAARLHGGCACRALSMRERALRAGRRRNGLEVRCA